MDRSLRAKVTGVDYSTVSVEKSRKVNADAIIKDRCKVLEASVSSLPFTDAHHGHCFRDRIFLAGRRQ